MRSFYSLGDGTKTYLTDMRNTKITGGGIDLSVPITTDVMILVPDYGVAKSLTIISTATKNSQDEKDFYKLVDSLKINQ